MSEVVGPVTFGEQYRHYALPQTRENVLVGLYPFFPSPSRRGHISLFLVFQKKCPEENIIVTQQEEVVT